jgi:hypothetical protein
LCCDTGAAKLGLGLGEPHFGILDPKVWEFDGNMSDWSGNDGGGLGGQRGDDCRIDLGLQGGGLFRHPKDKRKCGLELG